MPRQPHDNMQEDEVVVKQLTTSPRMSDGFRTRFHTDTSSIMPVKDIKPSVELPPSKLVPKEIHFTSLLINFKIIYYNSIIVWNNLFQLLIEDDVPMKAGWVRV